MKDQGRVIILLMRAKCFGPARVMTPHGISHDNFDKNLWDKLTIDDTSNINYSYTYIESING